MEEQLHQKNADLNTQEERIPQNTQIKEVLSHKETSS